MAKKKYKVRNWSEYNKALVQRGNVFMHLEDGKVENWYTAKVPVRKRGRPKEYTQVAIDFFFDGKSFVFTPVATVGGSGEHADDLGRLKAKQSALLAHFKKNGRPKKKTADSSEG